jgi:hypothetical protein
MSNCQQSRLRDPVTPSRNLTLHDDDDDLVITRCMQLWLQALSPDILIDPPSALRTPRGSRTITIPDDDEEGPGMLNLPLHTLHVKPNILLVASPSARPRPRLAAPASRILHHPNRDDPTRGWVFMGYTTTATARQVYAQIRTRADGIPVLAWNRIQLVDDVATLVGVHWNEVRLDEGVKDDMGTRGWKIGSAYEEVNPDMLREIKEYVAHQQATLASLQ